MGRAGKALKQVLGAHGITQNRLAVTMGIDRSNVSRWVNQTRDPSAEAVAEIKDALERIDPAAAEQFVFLYLYGSEVSYIADGSDGSSLYGSSLLHIEPLADGSHSAEITITVESPDGVRTADGASGSDGVSSPDGTGKSIGADHADGATGRDGTNNSEDGRFL